MIVGLENYGKAERLQDWRRWSRGKLRRVRTPEGARFYGAPIGTPIVADPKTGKLIAQRALPDPGTYTWRGVTADDGKGNLTKGKMIVKVNARGGGSLTWFTEDGVHGFTNRYPEDDDQELVDYVNEFMATAPDFEVAPVVYQEPQGLEKPIEELHVSLTGANPGASGWVHMGAKDAARDRLRQAKDVLSKYPAEQEAIRHVLLADHDLAPKWFQMQVRVKPLNTPGRLVGDDFANLLTGQRTKKVSPEDAERDYRMDDMWVGHAFGEDFVEVPMTTDEWANRVEDMVTSHERSASYPDWQARNEREVWEQVQANGFRVDPLYYLNEGERTGSPSLVAAVGDVTWREIDTEDPYRYSRPRTGQEGPQQALSLSKVRRVATPEGARFYGAPIGTPIVRDKTGKLRADLSRLPVSGGTGGIKDAEGYFDSLPEDVQARIRKVAQNPSAVARNSDPVYRDWWHKAGFKPIEVPMRPRGKWQIVPSEGQEWVTEAGDHIAVDAPLTPPQRTLLKADYDFVLGRIPARAKVRTVDLVVPASDPNMATREDGEVMGYVLDECSVIHLNPRMLGRGGSTEDSQRWVLLHELGHVIDGATGDSKRQDRADWEERIRPQVANGHAASDPAETYAEMFAIHTMRPGADPVAEEYAKRYGWDDLSQNAPREPEENRWAALASDLGLGDPPVPLEALRAVRGTSKYSPERSRLKAALKNRPFMEQLIWENIAEGDVLDTALRMWRGGFDRSMAMRRFIEGKGQAPAYQGDIETEFFARALWDAVSNGPEIGTVYRVHQGVLPDSPSMFAVATSEAEARGFFEAQETGSLTGQTLIRIDHARGVLFPDGREGIVAAPFGAVTVIEKRRRKAMTG